MHETFVFDLAVVLGVAGVTSVLARLLRQPSVLGYLLAGLIVGPSIPIPLFADPGRIEAMAEFGVILVMFAIGLEFRIAKLLRVLPVAGLTAAVQMGFLMWIGYSVGRALGWGTVEALFLGSSITISSTMVVSRVFDAVEVTPDVRNLVFGVLILQDVAAIALIATMTAVAAGGGLEPRELALTLARLGAVLGGMLLFGMLLVPRLVRMVERLRSPEMLGVFSIGLCFGFALLAEQFGYSVALGAFLAGILVAESGRAGAVEPRIEPVRDMFAAIFFVSVGMSVDPVRAWQVLPLSLAIFAAVVGGQLLSVSVAGILSGNGLRRSITAGLALGQIGEFAFILAGIGVGAGVVDAPLQPIVVTVAVLTAFTTPLLFKQAPRLAQAFDRRLPHRVQWLLRLYDSWLVRLRLPSPDETGRSPMRRALRAVALDAVGLHALMAITRLAWVPGPSWLATHLGVSERWGPVVILSIAATLAAPLLVGLVRNTLALGRVASVKLLESSAPARSTAASIVEHTLRWTVLLAVLLGVGLPTIAILRPLTGTFVGSIGLGALVAGVAFYLWRSAGRAERELRSGAEHVIELIAAQGGPTGGHPVARDPAIAPTELRDPHLPPGLESVLALPIPAGSPADGRTLAELDLRARTHATVVGIQRSGHPVILPTGHERLEAGDVLALVGSPEALQQAGDLLRRGDEPSPPCLDDAAKAPAT